MEPVPIRTPLRRLAVALLLGLACAALLGACRSEDEPPDAEALLDRAFRNSIRSADVKLDASLALDGLPGFERPVLLDATGPYVGGRRLPRFDLDVRLGAQGGGQTVQFGLLRTGSRAFVRFGGESYEQPRGAVRRANRDLARGRRGGSLRTLGLAPRTWVVGARDRGDAEVAGVDTHHVSGELDVRSLLGDLNELVERSASAVGSGAGSLSARQLDDLAELVRKPSFDVYVGKQDEVVRRLSAEFEIQVPEGSRAGLGGVEGGSLRFSIEFGDVDGGQRVAAPPRPRPLADLTTRIGGLGALGEGVESLARYSMCLDRAGPEDTAALSRCVELLE